MGGLTWLSLRTLGCSALRWHLWFRSLKFPSECGSIAAHSASPSVSHRQVISAEMPYVDINPHKGRPKWVGYTVLAVLLVLTVSVVAAALTHH